MEEYRVLNTNEIEKVTEKQILKPESSLNPTLNSEEALSAADLADGDAADDLADDAAHELSGEESVESLSSEVELNAAPELADASADAYSDFDVDSIDNILELKADQFPRFTLAKNKARFLRMVSDYRSKQEWLDVAPLSGVTKLFKQQTKELVGIRAKKLDYEMEIEMGTLTPVQISHRRDELKMCKVQEKMAVSLISKMQVKIRSGRR
jgi:hypothetical protein